MAPLSGLALNPETVYSFKCFHRNITRTSQNSIGLVKEQDGVEKHSATFEVILPPSRTIIQASFYGVSEECVGKPL